MNYKILTIPHSAQRYNTVGDYTLKHEQQINISVSDLAEIVPREFAFAVNRRNVETAERYEFLIMIHELVESFLCFQARIPFEEIDKFDMSYSGAGEPGDDINCPYFKQHKIASEIEKVVAAQFGIDWEEYESTIDLLSAQTEQEKVP